MQAPCVEPKIRCSGTASKQARFIFKILPYCQIFQRLPWLCLVETAKAETRTVAEKIRKFVGNYNFEGRETQPLGKVSLSIGVASYPEDGTDCSSLIECADQALYQAKKGGRDRVCPADNNLKNETGTQMVRSHLPLKYEHVLPGTNATSSHQRSI